MANSLFTYIGAFAVSFWFVYKFLPRLEGKR